MARIVFFASDLSETAQLARIHSFQSAGHTVSSVSFTKGKPLRTTPPDWPDLALGQIGEEALSQRLRMVLRALGPVARHRDTLARADVFIARNLDMVLLAWAARVRLRLKTPIIYECLDIHSVFTRTGAKARLARWIERRMLARSALLLVSSEGFITEYFEPVQKLSTPWALIENKLWFERDPPPRAVEAPKDAPTSDDPIVLGWVGAIRCRPSFDLLLETARAHGPALRIEVHGIIHDHVLDDFHDRIADLPNVSFEGPYDWPDGLAKVYRRCDLVWGQDLWQRGSNSDWLLPNRVYEAGWFGCPVIAVSGTQTAKKVAAQGSGFVLPAPRAEDLIDLLTGLDRPRLAQMRGAILAQQDTAFRQGPDDLNAIVAAVTAA